MNIASLRPDNVLLSALRDGDFNLIKPHLLRETRADGDVLYRPGDDVTRVHFPVGASLVSYAVANIDGHNVQTVLVGREGGVGGIVSAGGLPAYCLIAVKFGGPFLSVEMNRVQAAKDQSLTFRRMFERYADCLMAQMFQASACNAIHNIEQRAAKWILDETSRTGQMEVHLSHDDLASMLGVGRSYTTRVLRKFVSDGILKTARGFVTVTNKEALQQRSCNCNENVVSHFSRVLGGIYPAIE
ncbi:Crp/Fnr family transcriptional regulator [Aestuariivirga litoralis]|uniref:Crp/Fnr family transcriptional regulator n=1 Tax=Aestuariivirga litoralis TaxID=2650924 RepID=UPI0018C6AD76|nr:Crp/Fnr family transcriptional regulator [Aestuariivirga litoralis]MBG1232919.1 Crp/Fnr family transcriptional regulator [Aestuariivirga litoralis]